MLYPPPPLSSPTLPVSPPFHSSGAFSFFEEQRYGHQVFLRPGMHSVLITSSNVSYACMQQTHCNMLPRHQNPLFVQFFYFLLRYCYKAQMPKLNIIYVSQHQNKKNYLIRFGLNMTSTWLGLGKTHWIKPVQTLDRPQIKSRGGRNTFLAVKQYKITKAMNLQIWIFIYSKVLTTGWNKNWGTSYFLDKRFVIIIL